MHAAPAIVILFVIAAVVAVVARKVRVPYTVALVVAGLAFNALHLVQPPHLTKDLLYTLFLPGLVFEAAFAIELGRFKQSRGLILGLALPGLCVGIAVTTFLLLGLLRVTGAAPDLPIGTILVFSALICATDPIAVIALFKQLGAPKRLAVLVESESLLNDGTAAIAFTIVVDAVVGGTTDVGHGLAQFVVVVGAGLAIGAVVGGAASFLMRWIDDAMIETTLTTIAAYGSFVFAEHFHFSGILATVVAGVICGSYGAPRGMSPTTRLAVATFWEYLAFALNSLVFLMIGFEVRIADVVATGGITLLAYVAVTVGRALVVGAGAAIALRTKERIPWGWAAVVSWGGLRGALSMVLVLGLPAGLPGRDLLINVTFGVVTLSILLQGTSMSFLLRALGLARSSAQSDQEHPVAELRAARAASKELAKMRAEGLRDEIADELAREYEKRIESTVGATSAVGDADRVAAERRAALRRLALVEKDAVVAALRSGLIGEDTHHHVRQEIDARLHDLEDEH